MVGLPLLMLIQRKGLVMLYMDEMNYKAYY